METFVENIETFKKCDFLGTLTRSEAEIIQDYFKDENIVIERDVCNCGKNLNSQTPCEKCGIGGNSAIYCVRLKKLGRF